MLVVSLPTAGEALDLVPISRYRVLTGDKVSSDDDVTDALVEAVYLIEEYLRRKLNFAQHTESLTPKQGVVYPSCTPIATVSEEDTLNGSTIVLGSIPPFGRTASVVYTGGFTSRTLPATLAAAIASTARELLGAASTSSSTPYGASSIRVGDVSISYASGAGAGAGGLSSRVQRSIRAWRVRFL